MPAAYQSGQWTIGPDCLQKLCNAMSASLSFVLDYFALNAPIQLIIIVDLVVRR